MHFKRYGPGWEKYNFRVVNIRLPDTTIRVLDRIVEKTASSRNYIIHHLVLKADKDLETLKDELDKAEE